MNDPAGLLRTTELFLNRELSLVEFNRRVLYQATDPRVPLLERLRFLCIFSTNLDELFEIRVAGLREKAAVGAQPTGPENMAPSEVLRALSRRVHELVDEQYRILNEQLIPGLAVEQIHFLPRQDWSPVQRRWLRNYFENELAPVLSPLGLDPAHPFPRILNKSLNFIVALAGRDAFGRESGIAIVQAPRALPRIIQLPAEEIGGGPNDFVFLSSVIHEYVDELFPGMAVSGCYQFRVTRNSDLFVDEEEVQDLLRAVEGELPSRRYGDAVRLEVAHNCPEPMVDYLLRQFGLERADLYQVNGPVNLNRLQAICDLVDRPDLKYPSFTSGLPAPVMSGQDLFATIARQDILLHHPFESFVPVVEFLQQAAADPQVLAIKQTLYRTGPDSAVVDALVAAARAGKEVTVVIELRARFDEEANIELATRLQEVGAHVVYGVVGYKTHAKMILVVRRDGRSLRHYMHLGTGNYHPRTARLYTDYGLFTCDPGLGEDVHKIFLQLTGIGTSDAPEHLLQAPFTLHEGMLGRVRGLTESARAGGSARLVAKMNSLVEPRIIQALYEASQAGVEIDLIVRGMCSLRPGVPALSENIRVRSIVGRFLEHTRVFMFRDGDRVEVFCSSADWMERNFFRRVEVCFPLRDPVQRDRVCRELEHYLADNLQAWVMEPDGTYRRADPGEGPRSAQAELLEQLAEGVSGAEAAGGT